MVNIWIAESMNDIVYIYGILASIPYVHTIIPYHIPSKHIYIYI